MKRVKDLAKKTYHSTKNALPKPVFWSVPAVLAAVSVLLLVHLATDNTVKPTTARDAGRATVAIVRSDFKGGGTGVVLKSSDKESTVLTNSHVCRVVENGGVVVGDDGKQHAVTGYKKSRTHDLCLVTVASDLGVRTKLASSSPEDYSVATVAGHPSLLPTVVTSGHFSGHLIINVLTEITPCTEDDLKNQPLLCFFFGGIPKVSTYESQLVTATIQPGSSGSAVYNSKGEISGLVFAGSGDLGYAIIVPYEFVAYFIEEEQYTIEYSKPNNTKSIVQNASSKQGNDKDNKNKYREKTSEEISRDCMTRPEAKEHPEISKICKIFTRDMIQHSES